MRLIATFLQGACAVESAGDERAAQCVFFLLPCLGLVTVIGVSVSAASL